MEKDSIVSMAIVLIVNLRLFAQLQIFQDVDGAGAPNVIGEHIASIFIAKNLTLILFQILLNLEFVMIANVILINTLWAVKQNSAQEYDTKIIKKAVNLTWSPRTSAVI